MQKVDSNNSNIIYMKFKKLAINTKQPLKIVEIFLQWCNMVDGNDFVKIAIDDILSLSQPQLMTQELFSLYLNILISGNFDSNSIINLFNLCIKECPKSPGIFIYIIRRMDKILYLC